MKTPPNVKLPLLKTIKSWDPQPEAIIPKPWFEQLVHDLQFSPEATKKLLKAQILVTNDCIISNSGNDSPEIILKF